MTKFSVLKFFFFAEFALWIGIYIGYIIFVINIFAIRGSDIVILLWLLCSIFTVIWISYSLSKIKSIKRRIRRLFVLNINLIKQTENPALLRAGMNVQFS